MKYKRSIGDHIFDGINGLVMLLLVIITLYPFIYVLNYSISSGQTLGSLLLLPHGFTLEAYTSLLKDSAVLRAFGISAARSLLGPAISLLITGMAAYALSIPELIHGKFFRTFFVMTMYVSAGIIPTYIFMKAYHLTNSFWVYIVPGSFSAFNMVLIRTYIESIPESLREAVYLDGGNDLQAYWYVIFRVCQPVNAAVFLFGVLGQWNSYLDTQMYNTMSQALYTLQYVLANALSSQTNIETLKASGGSGATAQALKMAITVITVLPVMCVYPSLQKHFTSGIMIGSVKA